MNSGEIFSFHSPDYISANWIESSVWPPEKWSVFDRKIRTNNDVEGWHHALNVNAKGKKLPMYLLIEILEKEARLVKINVSYMSISHARPFYVHVYSIVFGIGSVDVCNIN